MKHVPRFDILFEPVQIGPVTAKNRFYPDVLEEAREAVDRILSTHQPLALDEEIDRELERIRKRAANGR